MTYDRAQEIVSAWLAGGFESPDLREAVRRVSEVAREGVSLLDHVAPAIDGDLADARNAFVERLR